MAASFRPWKRQVLLAGYSRDELKTPIDFAERAGDVMQGRGTEPNGGK